MTGLKTEPENFYYINCNPRVQTEETIQKKRLSMMHRIVVEEGGEFENIDQAVEHYNSLGYTNSLNKIKYGLRHKKDKFYYIK